MKKKITQTLLPIIMGLSVITQFACSDDNKSGSNYNGPLKLTTFYPDSGYLSSKIIIEGENLGTDASKLSVYFNKKKGYISQAAGNILMVYAPKLPGDTCIISVVKGNDSLTFDNKFRYISRFTVENVCGKTGSGYNIGGDLASTTFEGWRLKVGCCDPEGNYYSCYSNFGNNGGLALISEKKNLSKKIISDLVNDVMYHKVTEKLYAVSTQKNVIYEIDPSNDWKVKRRYLKPQDPPAKQVDYNSTARVAEAPFDSERKMMSTLHADGSSVVQYTKGAPDVLLPLCDRIWIDGRAEPMTDAHRAEIAARNHAMTGSALRVLAAAMRTYDALPGDTSPAALEQHLCFLGLTGMIDPVRPEVVDAIRACRSAGIRPVMITGVRNGKWVI